MRRLREQENYLNRLKIEEIKSALERLTTDPEGKAIAKADITLKQLRAAFRQTGCFQSC